MNKKTNFKEESFEIKNEFFPVFYFTPKNKSNKMIFYIPGLNGNGIIIKYWQNIINIDNFYLVSFDPRAQGQNYAKASRSYKRYLKDLKIIIDTFKQKYHIDHVYLIGESWGCALAVLYLKNYQDVDGIFVWNMPCKLIDITDESRCEKFKRNIKLIFTFLFFINTNNFAPFNKKLTNNHMLVRTIEVFKRNEISNKVIIASWRSFKPAWTFLLKNYAGLNFRYIQSQEDVLQDVKKTQKLRSKTNKAIIFEKGFHILTFDENVNQQLFNMIIKFAKIK